ncbi:MAG: hypothetical protein IPN33_22060 [Saprospiraceae bacterium]|nr:hypothetical protein [Saprospiraceae bacterium]
MRVHRDGFGTGVTLGPYTCNSTASSITITGTALFTTPIVPLSLNLSVQTSCICPGTNLFCFRISPVSIPTICCKTIAVADHVVRKDDVSYDVPIQVTNWSSAEQHLAGELVRIAKTGDIGICPNHWGGTPYHRITSPTYFGNPLHLNPKTSNRSVRIRHRISTIGPCMMLTSNIAMVTLCAPSTCDITGIDTCYTGTPIIPGLLTLNLNSPANACPPTIDWYDPNGMHVRSGPGPYQPTRALSMANPANCFEDFFYTVRITDECGQGDCQARIRLCCLTAAVGTAGDGSSPGVAAVLPRRRCHPQVYAHMRRRSAQVELVLRDCVGGPPPRSPIRES